MFTCMTFILFHFSSCEKDLEEQQQEVQTKLDNEFHAGSNMTIERSKSLYYQHFPLSSNRTDDGDFFNPIWFLAKEIQVLDETTITVVPIDLSSEGKRHIDGAQLVFYDDVSCNRSFELIQYLRGTDATDDIISEESFFGTMITLNFCENVQNVHHIVNDSILPPYQEYHFDPSRYYYWETICLDEDLYDPIKCPKVTDSNGWWNDVKNNWKNFWGNFPGGSGDYEHNPPGFGWWTSSTSGNGFPLYNTNWSGGGGATYGDFFDQEFPHGEGAKIKQSLEDVINYNDLLICPENLYLDLYACIDANRDNYIVGPPPPPHEDIPLNMFLSIIDNLSDNDPCFNEIKNKTGTDYDMSGDDGDFICFLNGNHPSLSDDEINKLLCIKNTFGIENSIQVDLVVENIDNVEFEDCSTALFPLSCESFDFEDCLALYQAAITGVSANFVDDITGDLVICPLTFSISIDNEGYGILGEGINLSIGQMQNIAAEAYNAAITEVVGIYGNQGISTIDCDYLEDDFIEIMDDELFRVALERYGVSEWSLEAPYVSFDLPNDCVVEPKLPKYDFSIFGLGIDNCE